MTPRTIEKTNKTQSRLSNMTFEHLDQYRLKVIATSLQEASVMLGVPQHIRSPKGYYYRLVAVYEYEEATSFPFCRKARYEAYKNGIRIDKTFRQFFNWGRDGWRPKSTRRGALPMFRAPLFQIKKRDQRIVISEGEKGVFRAIKAGWESDGTFFTCCLNEAQTETYSTAWKSDLWIIPDNDLSGYRRAKLLADRIPWAKVVDPRQTTGDLADIIEAGWHVNDFHTWLEVEQLTSAELSQLANGDGD